MKEMNAVEGLYVMMAKFIGIKNQGRREIEDIVHDSVRFLLAEFVKLAFDDFYNYLPPMRDIQHHIDLVSDASHPNLPYYQISPQKGEIFRRRSRSYCQRSLFTEGMSPCVVPVLLVQKKDDS